jgi:hypothetical protein
MLEQSTIDEYVSADHNPAAPANLRQLFHPKEFWQPINSNPRAGAGLKTYKTEERFKCTPGENL